jgi:porin
MILKAKSQPSLSRGAKRHRVFVFFTCLFFSLRPFVSLHASDADPGTYPLNLSGYYPDALLFNADYYHFKRVQDLYPNALLENTDQYFADRQKTLKELGVIPFLYYWGDFLANPVGGERQSAVWTQLLVVGAKIHLEGIGWEGGTLVVSFSDGAGNNLGQSVGNIFTPAQAQSFQTFANNALYLRQLFLDDRVELRLGRFSSASVFASLPAMGSLPVSGAVNGTPTSLFTNLSGWHSNGKPSWAAYVNVEPSKDIYFKSAILEVNPQANDANYHGFDMGMSSHDGTLLLTEWGWTPKFEGASNAVKDANPDDGRYPGIYMAGAYLQNYPQTQFNGQNCNEVYGFYWQGQQLIWRQHDHPRQNLSVWGGVTYSPQTQVAFLPIMGYGGVYYQGLISTRERDISMLNFYTGVISGDSSLQSSDSRKATQENVLELSYIVQLTDHFQIQPDLQWIIQPGGYSGAANSLVVGFQVAAQF